MKIYLTFTSVILMALCLLIFPVSAEIHQYYSMTDPDGYVRKHLPEEELDLKVAINFASCFGRDLSRLYTEVSTLILMYKNHHRAKYVVTSILALSMLPGIFEDGRKGARTVRNMGFGYCILYVASRILVNDVNIHGPVLGICFYATFRIGRGTKDEKVVERKKRKNTRDIIVGGG